jgi:hypothetical protein
MHTAGLLICKWQTKGDNGLTSLGYRKKYLTNSLLSLLKNSYAFKWVITERLFIVLSFQLLTTFSHPCVYTRQKNTCLYICMQTNRHHVTKWRGTASEIQDFATNSRVFSISTYPDWDGFGGLVVWVLASGSRVRGFEPGRSRWIFSV